MENIAEVYLLGGVALTSEIALPELPRVRAQSAPDRVNIRLGKVPASLPGAFELDSDCFATSSKYLLRIRGVAQYFVSEGKEILVEPEDHAVALDVRAYLLGSIFAVLCHQRGLLPLHAGAVSSPRGAIAFLGRSGEGKSSLVAHLAQRGFQIVADDICLIDNGAPPVVIPVAPWLKLWRASLQNLGHRAEDLDQVFSEDDKYRLPLEGTLQTQPISRLMFLERSTDAAQAEIREIRQIEAIPLLMNLTHQAHLLEATGKRAENFLRCGQVLSQAKAYRLIRPWGWEHMESTLDLIDRFLSECSVP